MQNNQQQPNPAQGGQAPQTGQKQIQIADNIPGAEYANMMQVNHTQEEFMMVYMNVAGQSGRVASKVLTSPGHMKRIVSALADNIKKYEEQFGEIKVADAQQTNTGIGFEERK
jgi:signal transduction histidine kinase